MVSYEENKVLLVQQLKNYSKVEAKRDSTVILFILTVSYKITSGANVIKLFKTESYNFCYKL
jgi:hypothetical protein